jgi:hypothetical protein
LDADNAFTKHSDRKKQTANNPKKIFEKRMRLFEPTLGHLFDGSVAHFDCFVKVLGSQGRKKIIKGWSDAAKK